MAGETDSSVIRYQLGFRVVNSVIKIARPGKDPEERERAKGNQRGNKAGGSVSQAGPRSGGSRLHGGEELLINTCSLPGCTLSWFSYVCFQFTIIYVTCTVMSTP